jgi:sulfur relay protein TusB/DsrH
VSKYILIETKSPLDGGSYAFEVGQQLKALRHDVTIYLLQDGVHAVRRTFKTGQQLVADAERSGLKVLVDSVSARQRGIVGERVAKGVSVSDMGALVDLVMEQADKAIWH